VVSKTNFKVETTITTTWVEEIASSPKIKATCTVVVIKEDSTLMLPLFQIIVQMQCHSNLIKTMAKIHMDKITIVGRMPCLAPRAHSTAKTVVIKVETCKIAKVPTKEDSEILLLVTLLNGSQSQRISTSHHKLHH